MRTIDEDIRDELQQANSSLARIEGLLGELIEATRVRRRRKPNATAKREAGLVTQGRSESANQEIIESVVRQWKAICPNNPSPILGDAYRLEILAFWMRMGEELDAVQGLFEAVARNRYWTGQTAANRKVSMREVITQPEAFIEGYAR